MPRLLRQGKGDWLWEPDDAPMSRLKSVMRDMSRVCHAVSFSSLRITLLVRSLNVHLRRLTYPFLSLPGLAALFMLAVSLRGPEDGQDVNNGCRCEEYAFEFLKFRHPSSLCTSTALLD